MNNVQQTNDLNTREKDPKLRHLLFCMAILLVFFSVGFYLLSMAMLIGLVMVIVASAITVGILLAVLRIHLRSHRSVAGKTTWGTRTFPLTSLILIIGISIAIVHWFGF